MSGIRKQTDKFGKSDFWHRLAKPFFVLAPMANVTDAAFRKMIASYGAPDVIWTEFVSADGLASAGKSKLLLDLQYSAKERPIVAQIFSGHPEAIRKAAKIVAELKFDGIDINMGCPDRAVEKQGGGAALIKNPHTAIEVIKAAREGVTLAGKSIPVTVKTRIGYNKDQSEEWIGKLLSFGLEDGNILPVITVHLRTRKEMSDYAAHWEMMPSIVAMRDRIQAGISPEKRTLIIGNGDVSSIADATKKAAETGCDGVMIGRGIFGKPWMFENRGKDARERSPKERIEAMLKHAKLFNKMFAKKKNFAIMKKHFKAYISGWDGAKELRASLMEADDLKAVEKIVKTVKKDMLE